MRLVLDTNVIVSANIQKGYPYFIVDRIFADPGLQLCISNPVFAEYVAVLNREKFSRFPDFHARAQTLLADIETYALRFNPVAKVALIADEPDNRFLELASACNADYFGTGNTNDFMMTCFKDTQIVSPREFFEILNR